MLLLSPEREKISKMQFLRATFMLAVLVSKTRLPLSSQVTFLAATDGLNLSSLQPQIPDDGDLRQGC